MWKKDGFDLESVFFIMYLKGIGYPMNKRQEDLLITLLEQRDFISASSLSNKLGVSTKTIYQDLKILESYLKSYNLVLNKLPRHGISIVGNLTEKNRLRIALFQGKRHEKPFNDYGEREASYLRQLIVGTEKNSILDFSISFYLSETSVRRDLEKIEHLLLPYKLTLSKEQGNLVLCGTEKEIRSFYRTYLISKYQFDVGSQNIEKNLADIFQEKIVRQVSQTMKKSKEIYSFSIPNHLEIYLMIDVLIATFRILQNQIIEAIDIEIEDDLRHFEVYPFASELLSNVLDIPIELIPKNEIKQISLTILSLGYITIPYKYNKFKGLTIHLIDKVSELSGIDFTQDMDLKEKITNHIGPMIYRLKNGIKLKNQTTEEIKKRYSILFNIVWLASQTVSEKYSINFLDSEIAFLTIYFQIAVEKIAKPLEICVICPHGLATSELIINSLRRLVSPYDNIKKIDFGQLNNEKVKSADIIISSVELETITFPYILVSPVMSHSDIETIRETYHSMVDGNRKTLSAINNYDFVNQSLIRNLIGNRIYLSKDCRNVTDSIYYLVNNNLSKENHTKEFLESIFDREKLGSTSVYTGIALPHSSPNTVQCSQLSFLSLKNPILWGDNMIKVIMLIAIKEGEEELYKDALIYIYSKIDNQVFINQLANANTSEEFMEVLLGKV